MPWQALGFDSVKAQLEFGLTKTRLGSSSIRILIKPNPSLGYVVRLSLAHIQPLTGFSPPVCLTTHHRRHQQKDKVVIVMGATGTGKSRLAIDLATQFPAEIVNCDKIQIYRGLDAVTNKVTEEECRGVPHHLLGIIDDPDVDFTVSDFTHHASLAIESIVGRGRLPIVAGGSNSFIQSLVEDDVCFKSRYAYCLIWVDVSPPVLRHFVSGRVDQMVEAGLVDEVRDLFHPDADYTRGLRRAIGVPELDKFMRSKGELEDAIDEIKANTRKLAKRQLSKIQRLRDTRGWRLHRIDATEAFKKKGLQADMAWERLVVGPAAVIVGRFLSNEGSTVVANKVKPRGKSVISRSVPSPSSSSVVAAAAMASS
ncbi:hypothetical protein Cgig2_016549 [Carnegiea gigantea]|uniref:adenylate dimethylallyltransferase (ADP/ATP-dependent) n=1 Tax=Carnegiea gigantea TaxID=171969 RepID=A0A9Q1KZX6_9CARY|nr:hypothetical protein Cgig2_016549 [Carnegiea gigantea]